MKARPDGRDKLRKWLEGLNALRVFRVVLAAMGAILLCLAFHRCAQLFDLRRWEATEGTIEISKVASKTVTHGRSRGTRYVPVVRYAYEIDGKVYRSERIAFGDLGNAHLTKVAPVVKRYPARTSVNVLYDPAEPHDAILESPGAILPLLATLGGLALLGIAGWRKAAQVVGKGLLLLAG